MKKKDTESGWLLAREGEVSCLCGIGHPIIGLRDPVHGCCGCCRKNSFPGVSEYKLLVEKSIDESKKK